MRQIVKAFLIIGTALLVCACVTTGNVQPISSLPPTTVVFAEKESYIIGPSDILEINVWKEPDLTRKVEVRMDGGITLPMINDIQAENLTLMELQEKIEAEYKNFISAPEVTVILLQSNSQRIYMLGKVGSPGEYQLRKATTFLQALSMAGGLDKWADKKNILLIRKIKGVEQTYRINYDAIVSGSDLSQNIFLQPDDTILVN